MEIRCSAMAAGQRLRRAQTPLAEWMEAGRAGRSYQTIANRLGRLGVQISHTALFRYEKARRMPPADVLWGLSKLYGSSFDDVMALALGTQTGPIPMMPLSEEQHDLLQEWDRLLTDERGAIREHIGLFLQRRPRLADAPPPDARTPLVPLARGDRSRE